MAAVDVEMVRLVSVNAFAALEGDLPQTQPAFARHRIEHLMSTDPGGCWVAARGERVVGAAIALCREGVWGLSLLVVDPGEQGSGVGRALLERAAAHGSEARGRIILSSPDPRALSAYLGLGLTMHPAACAQGRPRGPAPSGDVRKGGSADADLLAAVDRQVRGGAHGPDIEAMLQTGHRLLVLEDEGYALLSDDAVSLLAARDEPAAAELLRAALAEAEGELRVDWLTSAQGWAAQVCREAGLSLRLDWGALFTGGELGPLAPYLPSGAYL